jgi:hypothetical protein
MCRKYLRLQVTRTEVGEREHEHLKSQQTKEQGDTEVNESDIESLRSARVKDKATATPYTSKLFFGGQGYSQETGDRLSVKCARDGGSDFC